MNITLIRPQFYTNRKQNTSFGAATAQLRKEREEYHFSQSQTHQVKLPGYIPKSIKMNEVELVNKARKGREKDWTTYINENISAKDSRKIWQVLSYEIKSDNRRIPAPVDTKAILETLPEVNKLPEQKCSDIYNSNLIKSAINGILTNDCFAKTVIYNKDGEMLDKRKKNEILEQDALWIKIPSEKKDPIYYHENVYNVERLSNPNWCTRSKDDKAQEVLQDGDFYVYVENKNKLWSSNVAMTTYRGKIRQIQGQANNNLIPMQYAPTIKNFLVKNGCIAETPDGGIKNLKCDTGYTSDGPAAFTQLLISLFIDNIHV